jgi:hypothetical protein
LHDGPVDVSRVACLFQKLKSHGRSRATTNHANA